jgi:hypothetical protein
MGYGQPGANPLLGIEALGRNPDQVQLEVVPADFNPLAWELAGASVQSSRGFCQFQSGLQHDSALAAIALASVSGPPDDKLNKDGAASPFILDKAPLITADDDSSIQLPPLPPALGGNPFGRKSQPKDELPEEFVSQAIKEIVMHEVGHSLGLRHNFKASTMLTADQLHDTSITHVKGLVGSVMEYSPVNIAPKGKKQGDYYTTTIGPYDYWAIEYAYKIVDGDETTELAKIASRAPEHDLAYATDEDSFLNEDPYVNRWDLGSDPCEFAKGRIALASELFKDLDRRVVKDGESWSRTRRAFGVLLEQWGDAATLASQYVGGQSVSRDHKADKNARDPIVPIPGDKQRGCLKFLVEAILSDQSFQFSPTLLRRLGTERWSHWGSDSLAGSSADISVLERILGIQRIALGHCLSGDTLARLENQQLQANPDSKPLRMEEVFRALTDGVWSDLERLGNAKAGNGTKAAVTTIRRNLQREYLRRLGAMVLGIGSGTSPLNDQFNYVVFIRGGGTTIPADARALARLHLKEIASRINRVLESKQLAVDDTTRAHLEECQHRIAKVLEANLDVREP